MAEKLTKFLQSVLAGVVAPESLPNFDELEDTDIEAYAKDIQKKWKQKLSPEFKGQYYDTATKELLRGLNAQGVIDAEQISEFSTLKFDELTGKLSEVIKSKQTANMSESQKEIAAQVEKAKKAIEAQYQQQLNDLQNYQAKEYEGKIIGVINGAMPKGFAPTPVQLKALKSLIDSEVDIKFTDNDEANLFYKGTETIYGLNGDKKQILGLNDIVPKYLKELGIWSEKPKAEVKDFSNGSNGVPVTPPTVNQNGSLNKRKEAAKEFLKNLQ